jgi:hypothetical protein
MLTLASIFLVTLMISVTVIWVYRKISGWDGFSGALVGRPQPAKRMKIGTQQGFISLQRKSNKRPKSVMLRGRKIVVKTPWGW